MSDKIDDVIDSMGWDLDAQERADMRRLCEATIAQQPYSLAVPVAATVVPDGYRLVPVEPTVEMLDAGLDRHLPQTMSRARLALLYRAMLATAPAAPEVRYE